MNKMPEHPHIYPFKHSGGTAASPSRALRRKRERTEAALHIAKRAALGVVFFIIARAQIIGGLHPFGPACFAAAAVVWPRKSIPLALPVLLGLFTVTGGQDMLVYAAIIVLLSFVFLLYTLEGRKQWFLAPIMVAAAVMVSKGLFIALTSYTDYKLLLSLFESLIAAGMTLVFLVVLTALRRFDIALRFTADETVCLFLSMISLICGLDGWQLGVINVQTVISCLLIITAAYLSGGGAGAAVGALVGVAPSLSQTVMPISIAVYALSGLLAGIFGSFGRIGSAVGFVLGNLILAIYILEPLAITAALAASAAAGLVFLLLPGRLYKALSSAFAASGLKSSADEKNERLLRLAIRKLRSSGSSFHGLAVSLGGLAGESRVSEEANIRTAMEQLSHQLCSHCSLRNICWEIDYHDTFRGIVSLFEAVHDHGLAESKDAPDNFARRCPHINELIAIVNCLYDLYCRSNYWQQQRLSSRSLISGQMEGVAEVLEKLTRELTEHGDERDMLERELRRAISKRGLPIENAGIDSVSGRSIDAWAQYIECPGMDYCRPAVEEEAGRLLGVPYRVHESLCGNDCGGHCRYRLLAAGAHRMRIGQAQLAKSGREACGDSGGALLLDEGRQLLLISDGMGCGYTAAKESAEALSLVGSLLGAGFKHETAIDVVNAVLSLRGNEESFVTMDLCLVDLYSGAAEFIKTGASASYIKRGSAVTVIKGSSLPVGLLYNVDKESITEHVMPGDLIIMASDGLLGMDTAAEGAWLSRIIGEAVVKDPQALAEYLLDKAISICNGKIKDDITVLVAQMGEVA